MHVFISLLNEQLCWEEYSRHHHHFHDPPHAVCVGFLNGKSPPRRLAGVARSYPWRTTLGGVEFPVDVTRRGRLPWIVGWNTGRGEDLQLESVNHMLMVGRQLKAEISGLEPHALISLPADLSGVYQTTGNTTATALCPWLESCRRETLLMLGNVLLSGRYARGILYAGIALLVIAGYYVRAWRELQGRSAASLISGTPDSPGSQPWSEVLYLKCGVALSVFFFMLGGAAVADYDWLDRLVGCLMGLCGAITFAMFGAGFVSLTNLWKELVPQVRNAKTASLLLSIPLAVLYLGLGLGAFGFIGWLIEKIPQSCAFVFRRPVWVLIAIAFCGLWKGRSHAALMLRVILLVSFSAIIVAAAAFSFWWMTSQTAPLLVIFLSAMGSFSVLFYSRWVPVGGFKYYPK